MVKAKFDSNSDLIQISVDFSGVNKKDLSNFVSILYKIENDLKKESVIIFRDVRIKCMDVVCFKGEEDKAREVTERILRKNGIEIEKGG